MIKDFIKEIKKYGGVNSPAEKEVLKMADEIYYTLEKGEVKKDTRRIIVRLVEAINPDLSDVEKVEASICIELLIPAFLCELLSSGTLITEKKIKK
ncbi:hypothetical protein ES705_30593 [subsurface metagenome]